MSSICNSQSRIVEGKSSSRGDSFMESRSTSPYHSEREESSSRANQDDDSETTATISLSSMMNDVSSSSETLPWMSPSSCAANPKPPSMETSLRIPPLGTRQIHDDSLVSKPIPAAPQCHNAPSSTRIPSTSPSASVRRFEDPESKLIKGT